jgi:putative membrane protein
MVSCEGKRIMTINRSVLLVASSLALVHSVPAFAQQNQEPPGAALAAWGCYGPWHMWASGWGFWWIFPLIMFLIFFVCVPLLLLGRRWGAGSHLPGPSWHTTERAGRSWSDSTQSALQILNERYAKGEIDRQDYEERKAGILSSTAP